MLTVVSFYWDDPFGMNREYYRLTPDHVLILQEMVRRHLHVPHRFVCVSTEEIDGVECVPLDMTTYVEGTRFAKLMLFHPDIEVLLGKRLLYLDLDSVIVRDIGPLVDRDEDLVLWRNPRFGNGTNATRYNTSIMLLRAGSRPEFWKAFSPDRALAVTATMGGTDQAWVSWMAAENEAYWTAADGVYGAGSIERVNGKTTLPDNARVVFFPGKREPGQAAVMAEHPWIAEYRPEAGDGW